MADPTTHDVVTRDVPPLQLRAAFRPSSVDAEKRTVDITWTTGARVLRGFWERYYEELSLDPKHVRMGRLNNGAPLLDSHRMYDGTKAVIGVVESARIEKGEGIATVRFAKAEDDPEADKVFRKVVDGILQNISVGYMTHRLEKVEDGDEKIPVYRATDWEPFELSVVPVGADDGAGTRSTEGRTANPCVFVAQPKERTMPENVTPAAPTAPAPQSTTDDAAVRAAAEAATRAERERHSAIRALVSKHKLGDEFAARLLGDEKTAGMTIEQARAAVLDELAARDAAVPTVQHIRFEAGEDAGEKFRRGIEAAMLARTGLARVIRKAKETPEGAELLRDVSTDPGEFRWIRSYSDLARVCLERSTGKAVNLSGDALFDAALGRRSTVYATTTDFPVALANLMNKVYLGAYLTAAVDWRRFCGVKPAKDFRPHQLYRAGAFGQLLPLNEHGEIEQIGIPDTERAPYQVGTRAGRFALTRQALVNDDMGVFDDLGARGGEAAAETIEASVFALLALNGGLGPVMLDGNPLFDPAHNNITVQAAISAAAIDLDRVAMARQVDPAGNRVLNLQPAVLLVETALRGAALNINEAQYNPDRVANKGALEPNTVRGMFRDVVASPRFAAGTTRRYLFADPVRTPAIIVAFLDGEEAPRLESRWGFEVEGIEWKVVQDFGVAAVDWRPAITNAG